MHDILIVYRSTHGHTAKIAKRMTETMQGRGLSVQLADLENADPSPAESSAVIVAASVHVGKHQSDVVDWVQRHHDELVARPAAFVSVSLTAAEETDEARLALHDVLERFSKDSGWEPANVARIGGALQYREYNWFMRKAKRHIAKDHGQPGDTSRDYDFTDWQQVDDFSENFAETIEAMPLGS